MNSNKYDLRFLLLREYSIYYNCNVMIMGESVASAGRAT